MSADSVSSRLIDMSADSVSSRLEGLSADSVSSRLEGLSADSVSSRLEGLSADSASSRLIGMSADSVSSRTEGPKRWAWRCRTVSSTGALTGRLRSVNGVPASSMSIVGGSPAGSSPDQIRPYRSTVGKIRLQMVRAGASAGWAGM